MPKKFGARQAARIHGRDAHEPKIELAKTDAGHVAVAIGSEFSEITQKAALVMAQRLVSMTDITRERRENIVRCLIAAQDSEEVDRC